MGKVSIMDITVTQLKQFQVVAVSGRLDALTAPAFEAEARKLLEQGARAIILDMSDLEFVSSAGLRAILTLAKSLRSAQGEVRFAGLRPAVQEVFAISGFTSLFPIHRTLEEAGG